MLAGGLVEHLAGDLHAGGAGSAGRPHSAPDDDVSGAVVHSADLHQVLGEVGGLGVAGAQLLGHPLGVDPHRAHHPGDQPGDPQAQVERPRHLAIGENQVVAAGGRALGHREEPGQPPDDDPGGTADDGQRVRVAFLRHEHAGSGVGVRQINEVELAARPDLQVLSQFAEPGQQAGRGGQYVDQAIDLPHRVAGVLDHATEPQRVGDEATVREQPGAVDAACAARAAVDPVQLLQ